MIRLLFIDDDAQAQKTLKMVFADNYQVISAFTAKQGLSLLEEREPDLVLLDINLPDKDGLKVLEEIVAMPAPPPVVMLTVYPDIQFVKQAIQTGAYDYIVKPYELKQLEGTIRRALQNINTRKNFISDSTHEVLDCLIGEGRAVQALKEILLRYGPADSAVLIQGESGTGKELVARALHRLSPRHDFPFIPLNCGAIPESLLETELFGSERGAYTDAVTRPGVFERANNGTIFLDEIGEMPFQAQVKLLRVLESKELCRVGGNQQISLNLRIFSATNKDLKRELQEGRFREDLYYRISVLPISIPPLRERPEDVPILAAYFLKNLPGNVQCLGDEAARKLMSHTWPGNVRELKNVIERAILLAEGREIQSRDIIFN